MNMYVELLKWLRWLVVVKIEIEFEIYKFCDFATLNINPEFVLRSIEALQFAAYVTHP